MKTVIVLAMHGIPPLDYPKKELAEFFRLHSMVEGMGGPVSPEVRDRYDAAHRKVRDWPRSKLNDPFHAASQELAAELGRVSGHEVIVGYNEFCSPGLDEALREAARRDAGRVLVATTMMTRGGEHSEKDIPSKIADFKARHPQVGVVYAWPFEAGEVARFLNEHLSRFTCPPG